MKISVHGSIAADVSESWKHEPRNTVASREHEEPIRFECDDASTSVQLRQSQASEQRRYFARIVERAHGIVVVSERHHHAFRARVWPLARDRRPVSVNRNNFRSEASGDVQPM